MKIAVIGVSCRYPGADSVKALFENMLAVRRALREMPSERWPLEQYYHADKKKSDSGCCKKTALLDGFIFDPAGFCIPHPTRLAADTEHRLALKIAQEVLQDAQLTNIHTESAGVVIGSAFGEVSRGNPLRYRWLYVKHPVAELLDYFAISGENKQRLLDKIEELYKAPFASVNEDNLAGGASNTNAGRIYNFFDFNGEDFFAEGACYSSSLAINQAEVGYDFADVELNEGRGRGTQTGDIVGLVLTGSTRGIIARQDMMVCASDIGDCGQDADGFNQFVAYMYACGVPLKLNKLFEGHFFRPFSLPCRPSFIASPYEYPVAHELMGALGVRRSISYMKNASLQGLNDCVDGLKTGGQTKAKKLDLLLPSWVRTFTRKIIPHTLPQPLKAFSARRLVIAYEQHDALLAALRDHLQAGGIAVETIEVEAIKLETIEFQANATEGAGRSLSALDGCIYLANKPDELDAWLGTAEEDQNGRYLRPRALLSHSQKLLRAGYSGQGYFALVTGQGGHFGQHAFGAGPAVTEAGCSFVKSLHLEHPDIRTRCIDLNPALTSDIQAQLIIDELAREGGHIDAGYSDAHKRFTVEFLPVASATLPPAKRPLEAGDVMLITGGGKGITAECALALKQTVNLKFALVGSSHLPADSEVGGDELSLNLRRFAEAGIVYRYYSCDMSDAIQVQQLVARVEKNFGPVDAIWHAAGVDVLQKIASADWDNFQRLLRPKMDGFVNLLAAVDIAKLKSVMVFSSLIACSGMAGNSNSAYANEWMSQLLRRLHVKYPSTAFQAYCFSAWSDFGMGARGNNIELLDNMGINAVPVEEGTQLLQQLALKTWPDNELLISSRMGSLDTIRFVGEELPKLRFIDKVLQWQPGVELITEVFLDPKVDCYLNDHNYEGSLLFPAVMGIEAMVQCVTACRGLSFTELPELLNLQFTHAIIVPIQGRAIRIYSQIDEPQANGEQRARGAIRSSVTNYDQDYFSCECVWNRATSKPPMITPPRGKPLPLNPKHDLYGKILFQGPMFQNISGYQELSSVHCLADISLPKNNQLFSNDSVEYVPQFGSGQVRDAFLHAVQLCVPQYRILPVSMERIFHVGYRGKKVFLFAREREKNGREFIYDLEVYDETGKCIELITGFRCRIMADNEDRENLSLIQAVHQSSAGMAVA